MMANKNLFPKDDKAVKTTKKAAKSKKEDEPKIQEPVEEKPTTQKEEVSQVKSPKGKKLKVTATKEKKPSMVQAALRVLSNAKEPMTSKELVEAMTTKGLWSSPQGKTPANTLYSAFLRLIQNQGREAPIRKADTGTFEINPSATA
jgi:hypothetical protein